MTDHQEAEQQLDQFLEGLAGAPAIKQWLLGWLERQMTRTRQEAVEGCLEAHWTRCEACDPRAERWCEEAVAIRAQGKVPA